MILTKLLPHQNRAIQPIWNCLNRTGKCACFMFKGSGKSLISFTVAQKLGAKRILITSDKLNVETTWPDQINRHTQDWAYFVRPNLKELAWLQTSGPPEDGPVCVLVNYDYLVNFEHQKLLRSIPFDLWIGDESSEFKDQRTGKHKACARVTASIPNKLILNGDPATEALEDLFGQFKMLDEGKRLGYNITSFRLKYMQMDRQGYKWIPRRSSLTEVQAKVKDISYWCHFDPTVVMPTPHYYCLEVEQTPEQRKLNADLLFTFAAEWKDQRIETNYAPVVFQKMVQVAGGVFRPGSTSAEQETDTVIPDEVTWVPTLKTGLLRKIIQDNPKSKIVVWHNYIPETVRLYEMLYHWGHRVIKAEPPHVQLALDEFRSLKGGGILLLRCSACRGINQLADADIAIFYSNPFSYARRAQAEGRTQRVSSTTKDTHIFDLITKGGADEMVYRQIQGKRNFSLTLPILRTILDEIKP